MSRLGTPKSRLGFGTPKSRPVSSRSRYSKVSSRLGFEAPCLDSTSGIILFRIGPIIDKKLPIEQAGFRPGRDSIEQVLALTSFIETGFEKRLKTDTVFFDLSAAYDTIWHNGVILKLIKINKCKNTIKLLKHMTGPRNFTVLLGGDLSKTRMIKNRVPQGSVLASTFFNVYTADIPDTIFRNLLILTT